MNNRFLNLDALRGIAALLVVWQHTSESFVRKAAIAEHGTALADMAAAVDFGRIGVICFFLISGFVIPYSLSGANASLKTFAIRRFFRLYPVYWLSLFTAVALAHFLEQPEFSSATVAANATMIQGLMGYQDIQGLYWTLTVELLFYCLCALAFTFNLLQRRLPLLLMCWGNLGLFVLWRLASKVAPQLDEFPSTITYIPYCLSVMFCGALIRHCYSTRSSYFYAGLGILGVFALPLCVLILGVIGVNVVESPTRFGSSHLIALAIFFTVLLFPTRPPRLLLALGTISYSVYLFHPAAMRLVSWVTNQGWAEFFSGLHLGTYILSVALLSAGAARIIYQLVELPSINIGRRLTARELNESINGTPSASAG